MFNTAGAGCGRGATYAPLKKINYLRKPASLRTGTHFKVNKRDGEVGAGFEKKNGRWEVGAKLYLSASLLLNHST